MSEAAARATHLATLKWLLEQWGEETARALQSMTDARPAPSCEPLSAEGEPSDIEPAKVYLEITFSAAPGAVMWVALPEEAVDALGKRTLEAAGIDDAGPEELQNTCLEILQQAHAGLAQAISARIKRAVTSKGKETGGIDDGNSLFRLELSYPNSPVIVSYGAVSSLLVAALDIPTEIEVAPAVPDERIAPLPTSKTFEVLLDVSMPVSVSFGRTEMAIKEVLKLTTGSIVELNRALTEPVEVIVNDRVIARGEVVVVDGNYGVRIHQIVSRQERFRSSAQAAMIAKHPVINP
jgi:flagellar motor switch protein FliN/FliY